MHMDETAKGSTSEDTLKEILNEEPVSYQNTGNHDPVKQPEPLPGMTLEQIIDVTGEFSHLNELVMLHIEYSGGFIGADAYFRIVQPILDLLEIEIRVRCNTAINLQQMKLVVQDWIDQEIKDVLANGSVKGQVQNK